MGKQEKDSEETRGGKCERMCVWKCTCSVMSVKDKGKYRKSRQSHTVHLPATLIETSVHLANHVAAA